MKIIVLGAGRVGSAMVRDLARGGEFELTVVDASQSALDRLADLPGVQRRQSALDPAAIRQAVADFDLVVGALPGHVGFACLEAILQAGKNVVDISFFAEDPFRLDTLAKEKGCIAIMDCGIAPGCSNMIIGRLRAALDEVGSFVCMVGGLPAIRTWPFEYKAPFSPADVIEEYVRPARYVMHNLEVTMPALSEPELVEFAGVGTLEAFNTDGLRSLITTERVPYMKELTLRYPGHIERMRMLRESGFFSQEPVEVGGAKVRPLDFTSRLLFPLWQFHEGEEDFTVMRVCVEGKEKGRPVRYQYELLDRYDRATGIMSMARTTGYTCTAAVRMVARGLFQRKGISPPEFIGRDEQCYRFMMEQLAERGVVFRETVTR